MLFKISIKHNKFYLRPLFLGIVFSIVILFTIFWYSIPEKLFADPTCTVLYASNGDLLSAIISADGQYRFPSSDSIPERFARSIVMFEDRFFYRHPGVNPFSIVRSAWQNIKERRIVSGASTITMQTIRLFRKGKNRTFAEKAIEIVLAFRLEMRSSKHEILKLYSSNAPFGGNVVGIEAAAWRYYGHSPSELSWAEAAALAVLPNAPSLVFPGRNPEALRQKRNKLLKKLLFSGDIDSTTYSLSIQEPLPGEPKPLPQLAMHLLTRAITEGMKGEKIFSTINPYYQERVTSVLHRHHKRLTGNQIHNAAVLVVEIETGNAIAYLGNMPGSEQGEHVDIITAPRSTGSILKPFLYAAMLNDGLILPRSLIPDIPSQIGGFTPKNFFGGYDGAVPAARALSRSLNVPAVRMLHQYGVFMFHDLLNKLGLTTITRPSSNYGLSLILGGAEATLWDLTGVYASMARTLNRFRYYESRYNRWEYQQPKYIRSSNIDKDPILQDHSVLDAAAIYFTFEAMREVTRPDELMGWKYFASSRSVAWKTGTSFGHRDAWAIGLNPHFVVGVWVGNASGEGRPDLTGVGAAAPILFDVFELLPPSPWFEMPFDDMARVAVCSQSGHRASDICQPVDTVWIPAKGLQTVACPYHQLVHLNAKRTHRVTDRCLSVSQMNIETWFVLPPAMEWYYRSKNPTYKPLPPFLEGCDIKGRSNPMALLYPRIENTTVFIPRDLDGNYSEAIFEVAHREEGATIFWHLNEEYLGFTQSFHRMGINPGKGMHKLILVDGEGNALEVQFNVQ
jgi:penicillin-binding protein 1C